MIVNGHRNWGAALLGLAAAVLSASLGCDAAPAPTTVDIAGLRPGPDRIQAQEVLRCCEWHFPPRRRAECVFEGLHDHGVCAKRPVPPRDAGSRDAGRDLATLPDAASKDAAPDQGAPVDANAGGGCGLAIISITPSETVPAGTLVPVSVLAVDSNPAAIVSFVWTSSNVLTGTNPGTSASVTIPCVGVPSVTLTATVSDGTCQQTVSTIITCAPSCGDGVVESAEQCDPPRAGGDGLQCGPDCQWLNCGNGQIDPGEQCDPHWPRSAA